MAYCLTATVHASSDSIGYDQRDSVGDTYPLILEAPRVEALLFAASSRKDFVRSSHANT
jgi:hypothetical protein